MCIKFNRWFFILMFILYAFWFLYWTVAGTTVIILYMYPRLPYRIAYWLFTRRFELTFGILSLNFRIWWFCLSIRAWIYFAYFNRWRPIILPLLIFWFNVGRMLLRFSRFLNLIPSELPFQLPLLPILSVYGLLGASSKTKVIIYAFKLLIIFRYILLGISTHLFISIDTVLESLHELV